MSDSVVRVFSEVLGIDPSSITDASSPDNVPQWDSLAVMRLVAGIEEAFAIELTTREIMSMRTVGMVRTVLRKRGVENA